MNKKEDTIDEDTIDECFDKFPKGSGSSSKKSSGSSSKKGSGSSGSRKKKRKKERQKERKAEEEEKKKEKEKKQKEAEKNKLKKLREKHKKQKENQNNKAQSVKQEELEEEERLELLKDRVDDANDWNTKCQEKKEQKGITDEDVSDLLKKYSSDRMYNANENHMSYRIDDDRTIQTFFNDGDKDTGTDDCVGYKWYLDPYDECDCGDISKFAIYYRNRDYCSGSKDGVMLKTEDDTGCECKWKMIKEYENRKECVKDDNKRNGIYKLA